MTSPELPAGRPIPDTDDLRLLAEIVNNGAIGLPQAAWNARMSQAEAAARLVQMAERNLPLRLVAEGDRQLLWRIAQAGPATSGVPVGGPGPHGFGPQGQASQGVGPHGAGPGQPDPGQPGPGLPGGPPVGPAGPGQPQPWSNQPGQPPSGQAQFGQPQYSQPQVDQPQHGQPQYGSPQSGQVPGQQPPGAPSGALPVSGAVGGDVGGPSGAQSGQIPVGAVPVRPSGPVPVGGPASGPALASPPPLSAPGPVVLPPTPAVPPHEQAIAGAVPLGQPPFGTPPAEASTSADAGTPSPGAPPADNPAAVWGVPGNAAWTRSEPAPDADAPPADYVGEQPPSPELGVEAGAGAAAAAWAPDQVAKDVDPAVTQVPAANPAEDWRPEQVARDAPVEQPAVADVMVAAGENQIAKDAGSESPDGVDGPAADEPAGAPEIVAADAVPAPVPASASASASDPGFQPVPVPVPTPEPEPLPARQVYATSPAQVQWQTTIGLAGEQLWVTLLEVIDPADSVLTDAGYRLDPGERAVLVRTAMANHGPAPHDALPDHYLVLRTDTGAILTKAPMGVGSHPAYRVGVAPGGQADGWTVFLIPADTVLTEVIWSVRPDLVDRTLTWRV